MFNHQIAVVVKDEYFNTSTQEKLDAKRILVAQNGDRVGFQYNLVVAGVSGNAGHFDTTAPFYVADAEL